MDKFIQTVGHFVLPSAITCITQPKEYRCDMEWGFDIHLKGTILPLRWKYSAVAQENADAAYHKATDAHHQLRGKLNELEQF